MEKDFNEWILHLEGLKIQMNEFRKKGGISDKDFMIHILNNFPNIMIGLMKKIEKEI